MLSGPIHNLHRTTEGVGLGEKIRSSVSNTVTLRYLLDILVDMYSRQGNKMQSNVVKHRLWDQSAWVHIIHHLLAV